MPDQGGDNLVIRTMNDDLASAGAAKPASSVASAASFTGPKPSQPALVKQVVSPVITKPTSLPLPPRQETPPAVPAPFQPTAPNLARRNRRRVAIWVGSLVGALALIGGGIWAFITFFSAPGSAIPSISPSANLSGASVPIPSSASIAIHYGSLTSETRSKLLELWQNSPKTLLQGNPKSLLNRGESSQFMYVMLAGDARPYLLLPKSEMDIQELSKLSPSQVVEYNGLYILHALNAQPYLAALAQTQTVNPLTEGLDDTSDPRPLRIYLSESALNQIRSQTAGEAFASGMVKELLLDATPASSGKGLIFESTSQATNPSSSSPIPAGVDQNLLSSVPADATFIRLGANLGFDSQAWARHLDADILEKPAVAALVAQLTSPYAYYHRLGPDGRKDLGLVTSVPSTFTLGEPALEDSLKAAIPLIVGSRPANNLAFSDGTYQNLALRYLNLNGPTEALDYAMQDGKLKIASSKEGMFALLEKKDVASPWKSLFDQWGAIPAASQMYLGHLTYQPFLDLLPASQTSLATSIVKEDTPTGGSYAGVIQVGL